MIEEIVVVNELGEDGIRRVKVISNTEIDAGVWVARVPVSARSLAVAESTRDAALGIYAMTMTWPVYEATEFSSPLWPRMRRLFAARVLEGQRVSEAISAAKVEYFLQTGYNPGVVFVRELPPKAENGMLVDGMILLESEWAPRNCVVLGGRE